MMPPTYAYPYDKAIILSVFFSIYAKKLSGNLNLISNQYTKYEGPSRHTTGIKNGTSNSLAGPCIKRMELLGR